MTTEARTTGIFGYVGSYTADRNIAVTDSKNTNQFEMVISFMEALSGLVDESQMKVGVLDVPPYIFVNRFGGTGQVWGALFSLAAEIAREGNYRYALNYFVNCNSINNRIIFKIIHQIIYKIIRLII